MMGIIIVYVVFATFWTIGFDVVANHGKLSLKNVLYAILLGWAVMPFAYGAKRGNEVH